MYTKFPTTKFALLSILLLTFFVIQPATGQHTTSGNHSYLIKEVKTEITDDSLSLIIQGDSPPAFTKYETFGPFRVVVDIAQATLDESLDKKLLLPDNNFAKLTTTILQDQASPLIRFEFQMQDGAPYSVNKDGNSIVINIQKSGNLPEDQAATTAKDSPIFKNIEVMAGKEQTKVLLMADRSITSYNSDTVLGNARLPDRMFIDIDQVDGKNLPKEKIIDNGVIKRIRVAQRGTGVRIVFDSGSTGLFHYEINPDPQGLLVILGQPGPQAKNKSQSTTVAAKSDDANNTLKSLIDSSSAAVATGGQTVSKPQDSTSAQVLDKYDFSGYKNKRISIDFYKIDIHNIFRLLREITDLNIVVDEAVNGSLTLALNDVPWDFALDIILNLTDLEKEQRYNTIVIYPKKKKFNWPERASDNLDVKVDLEIIEEEALIVQKAASQPKEIIQAKSLMQKAQKEEGRNNLEEAAKLYEQAFELWPSNNKIANKLATLYLVGLRINAKAVNFAKKSLTINPQDTRAALYAAIGMTNMNRLPEAMEYFNQAVSDSPPAKEALISYAAFSENNDQPEAALKLLGKFESYYGDTIDTMMARARIYDKIGQTDKATSEYKALFNSGFQLRPDLKKFIQGRIAAKDMKTGN